MKIKQIPVGDASTNCYIIFSKDEKKAMLIDPSFETGKIEHELEGAIVEKIFLTHGHVDHIYECNFFIEKYGAKIYTHEKTKKYLLDRSLNNPMNIFPELDDRIYNVDTVVKDGDIINFDEYDFKVIHTPGHTEGCSCLICENNIFVGDVLFYLSIGRTDFPLGSMDTLLKSIAKLMLLDDNVNVYPGHMQKTTIGHERKNNPYIQYYLNKNLNK